jgi:hypothetical protein
MRMERVFFGKVIRPSYRLRAAPADEVMQGPAGKSGLCRRHNLC